MIVLDTTIVNVALPSIAADLGFTETSLVWVINAYMLTFGGCLLLGGRLGELYFTASCSSAVSRSAPFALCMRVCFRSRGWASRRRP
jgi:MFS family permease